MLPRLTEIDIPLLQHCIDQANTLNEMKAEEPLSATLFRPEPLLAQPSFDTLSNQIKQPVINQDAPTSLFAQNLPQSQAFVPIQLGMDPIKPPMSPASFKLKQLIEQQQIQAFKQDPMNRDYLLKSVISETSSNGSASLPRLMRSPWNGPDQFNNLRPTPIVSIDEVKRKLAGFVSNADAARERQHSNNSSADIIMRTNSVARLQEQGMMNRQVPAVTHELFK